MELEILKKQVLNIVNNSKLNIGVIYYVFKDIMDIIEKEYSNYLIRVSKSNNENKSYEIKCNTLEEDKVEEDNLPKEE